MRPEESNDNRPFVTNENAEVDSSGRIAPLGMTMCRFSGRLLILSLSTLQFPTKSRILARQCVKILLFMNLAVLVLAAGKGTRMESDLPKVLHPLRGRPLVAHVLEAALLLAPARLICIVGHRAELVESEVKRAFPQAEFVNQGEMLGTGHAVTQTKTALENFDGEILVTCGDAPLLTGETLFDLVERRRQDNAAAAMLVGRLDDPARYGRVLMAPGGDVEKIVEWKDASEAERNVETVNAGTYVFRAGDLWKQLARVTNDNASGEFYLTDVIGLLRQDEQKVVGILVSEREMTGINTRAELADLETQLVEEERLQAENEAMPS